MVKIDFHISCFKISIGFFIGFFSSNVNLVISSLTVPPNNLQTMSTFLELGGGNRFSFCGLIGMLHGVVAQLVDNGASSTISPNLIIFQ